MHTKSITEDIADLTVSQMEARAKALRDAASLLRSRATDNTDDALQGEAVADWFNIEALKWDARAERSRDVLSVAQRRTFDHFLNYVRTHAKSPTVVELAQMEGVTTSSINARLDVLVRKGFLVKTANIRAGLSLCPGSKDTAEAQ